jgi:hypothetical protein
VLVAGQARLAASGQALLPALLLNRLQRVLWLKRLRAPLLSLGRCALRLNC